MNNTLFDVEEFNKPPDPPKPYKAPHDKKGKFTNELIAKADREERRANGESIRNTYLTSVIAGMAKQLRWRDDKILELKGY